MVIFSKGMAYVNQGKNNDKKVSLTAQLWVNLTWLQENPTYLQGFLPTFD